jgi:hypothetical protein
MPPNASGFYARSMATSKTSRPVNQPPKAALVAGLIAMLVAGAIVTSLAKSENLCYEFCTTKAYGWPTPWKIEYCECEGAKTVHPVASRIVNLSSIAGTGLVGFFLFGGLSWLLRHRK